MQQVLDNGQIFATSEFDYWAHRSELISEEAALIERYLDKHESTLEAGTGGGRILCSMKRDGFTSLAGFDCVPEMIEQAREKDPAISFTVQDALSLDYPDRAFGQAIYLQQLLSLFDHAGQHQVLSECYRILKPGGIALFSFLCFDVRVRSCLYRPYLLYLALLRWLFRSKRSIQFLPWLKLHSRFNPGCLLDRGPHVYWFKVSEAESILRQAGFRILEIVTSKMLYVVCTKPY